MLPLKPFMKALFYVPLRRVDVPAVMRDCTVRWVVPKENEESFEDNFEEEEQEGQEDGTEFKCYDLSVPGFIGMPRAYGLQKYPNVRWFDLTTKMRRQPELFPKLIKPRDAAQREFWETLRSIIRAESKPLDLIANAPTGSGKTVTALWLQQEVIQSPLLVTVPTNFLKRQWVQRITDFMGKEWCDKYVGIIQQDKFDIEGKLICVGLAPSLARRNYPKIVRDTFGAIIFDEWHKIPAPSTSSILAKYPAELRLALTATNRLDALLKVSRLHMGKPRVQSKQEVMRPLVYVYKYQRTLPRNTPIFSEHHVTSLLSKMRDRNDKLADIIADGYRRGRVILGLSDRTEQLGALRDLLVRRGVPLDAIGIVVGSYTDGWRINRKGERVKRKVKMTEADQNATIDRSTIVLATYGLFDTGADVAKLDMGVELTPRGNVRQALGRILRIQKGKPTPEWHGLDDYLMTYPDSSATMFADPAGPVPMDLLIGKMNGRRSSYTFQKATIIEKET